MSRTRIGRSAIIGAWILFVLSLTLPVWYEEGQGHNTTYGYEVLLSGWLGILTFSLPFFGWLANPLMILANIMMFTRSRGVTGVLVAATIALAIFTLLLKETEIGSFDTFKIKITGFGPGYFLWLSSLFLNCVGVVVFCWDNESNKNAQTKTASGSTNANPP